MQPFKAMMSDQEINIIEMLLKPHYDVLEFGSGYSTVYFSQFVKSWTAIEHDQDWFNKVTNFGEMNFDNTKVVKANEINYTTVAYLQNKQYDLILIDGIRRKDCFNVALNLLKPDGRILVHDASRAEYKEWINSIPGSVLCEGEMPDPNNPGYYLIRGLKIWKLL